MLDYGTRRSSPSAQPPLINVLAVRKLSRISSGIAAHFCRFQTEPYGGHREDVFHTKVFEGLHPRSGSVVHHNSRYDLPVTQATFTVYCMN